MWFCHVTCLILLNIPAGVTIHPLSLSLPPFLPSLCLCPSLSTYLSLFLPTPLSLSPSFSLFTYLSNSLLHFVFILLYLPIYFIYLSLSLSLAPSTSYYGKSLLFQRFLCFLSFRVSLSPFVSSVQLVQSVFCLCAYVRAVSLLHYLCLPLRCSHSCAGW